MIRRSFRIGLMLAVLGGLAFALTKLLGQRSAATAHQASVPTEPWPRLSEPEPAPTAPWVEPIDGTCPGSHPIKAKLTSKIFHLPGMANYERTNPDRCYLDATTAEADGLRPAKR